MMLSRTVLSQLRPSLRSLSRSLSGTASDPPSVPANADSSSSSSVPAPQAPNYPTTWSTNQRPRPTSNTGPRFEQTVMELQPNPLSAMELIANEPVRLVHGRRAVCDGGAGPLGHPKIYINLDQPGPRSCGYCGLRFEQAPHHHH